jgi:hypothetical protein
MIDCGSKSSHRFTIFLFLIILQTTSAITTYLLNS